MTRAAGSPPPAQAGADIHRYMAGGIIVVMLLAAGIGVWAGETEIAGAVIAPATVVVESNVKKVQHPAGGIVGEIRVRNGDRVRAGDLLVRLDETVARASLQTIVHELGELAVREARLKCERDGGAEFDLPRQLEKRETDPDVAELVAGERSLLKSRRETRDGQKAQLRERIAQLIEEIMGITGQMAAKDREIELIDKELEGLERLEAERLVTTAKMVALRREAARLEGERGQLGSAAAQGRGRIAEIELQILRLDQEAKTAIVEELRENQAKQAELDERRIAAEDLLRRIEIRAPQAGVVHQLGVHTVGGVIGAGEQIMLIVPEGDRLNLEARITPYDIDEVLGSKRALVRFPAFNERTTPELEGVVRGVSADIAHDARTGESYYLVRIEILDAELARLGEKRLVPGMPAEVQIQTHSRTALSYLIKPLEDQVARSFKER